MTSVTDFTQYADLRTLAGSDRNAALEKVAGQFEALFVQEMLKSMRDAGFGDPIFGNSNGSETYREMFDQQIASDIASGNGIGLKEMLIRQLGGSPRSGGATPAPATTLLAGPVRGGEPAPVTGAAPVSETPDTVAGWSDPRAFVADILPHARQVAERLGVSPLGVLAQAALETGWGQHVMPGDNGASSLNLFGIKAGSDWRGGAVTRDTLEFEGGAMQPRREAFRAYESLADAFRDYGAFLEDRERYSDVRERDDDVAGFAEALQRAGYATDPDYAAKIRRVAGGTTMRGVLGALKETDLLSLATNVR